MSVLLNDVTPDFLQRTAAVSVSFPFAMSLWIYIDDITIDQVLMALANSTSEDNFHALMMIGTGSNQIRARTRDNLGAVGDANTTAGITANTWHHALGIWNSASDRRVFLDGANLGTDVTALGAVVGLDRTSVGRLQKLTPILPTSGRVAEMVIWDLSSLLSTAEITQLAASFSPLLTRLNEIVLYVPGYDVNTNPINDLVGANHLTQNGTPATADHTPIIKPIGQWVKPFKTGILLQTVTQSINFGQQVAVVEKHGRASNAIVFGQSVGISVEYNRSITQNIDFLQTARHNIIVLAITQNINFGQTVQPTLDLTIPISQALLFDQRSKTTIEESISQAIAFAQQLARGELVTQAINFGQSTTVEQSKSLKNDINFGQQVGLNYELGRLLQSTINFGQSVSVIVVRNCTLAGLPQGTSLLLTAAGATPLILRNPEFGNSEQVQPRRIFTRSRGGTINIFRDTTWPEDSTLNFTVKALTQAEAALVLTFIQESLGKLVTLDDQDNRIWTGVIETPEDVRIIERTECDYSAEFNLTAVLT